MAQENIILNVEVKGGNAEKTVGSIRTQLREANQELIKAQEEFGQYSDQAVKAAKRVAELKDRVKDAAETAAAFDPGRRFAAFSSALQGVAGGFAAVQGALGLVGVESEDVQKQLLKVQSALALSQGLSQIGELGKSFKGVATVLSSFAPIQKANAAANTLAASTMRAFGVATTQTSAAFRILRAAIIATGIGALVVAVGFLIEKIVSWTSSTKDAEEAQKALNNELERQNKLLAQSLKEIDNATKLELARARAVGKSVKEIKEIKDKGYREELAALQDQQAKLDKLADDADKNEQIKEEDRKKARQAADENFAKIQEKIFAKTLSDEEEKAAAAEKKRAENSKKSDNETIKNTKDALAELDKLRNDARLETIKDENERAKAAIDIQLQSDKDRIKALELSKQIEKELIDEYEKKAIADKAAIDKKAQEDREKIETENADKLAKLRAQISIAGIKDEGERKRAQVRQNYAEEIAEVEKSEGDKTQIILALKEKEKQELEALDIEDAQKNAERLKTNQDIELEIRRGYADTIAEQRQVELDAINAEFDARVARAAQTGEEIYLIEQLRAQRVDEVNKKSAESEIALTKMRIASASEALGAVGQVAGNIAKLVGEQTALGKTLAIAQAVIETAISAQRAYSSTVGIPIVGPFLAPVAAATAVAFGIKNIRTIQQTKIPGARDGGGSIPNIESATAAPIRPQANQQVIGQELNRQAINRVGNAATRAYVVESDVTNSQERIKRLNRAARLG